jgi:hypothetical protein
MRLLHEQPRSGRKRVPNVAIRCEASAALDALGHCVGEPGSTIDRRAHLRLPNGVPWTDVEDTYGGVRRLRNRDLEGTVSGQPRWRTDFMTTSRARHESS